MNNLCPDTGSTECADLEESLRKRLLNVTVNGSCFGESSVIKVIVVESLLKYVFNILPSGSLIPEEPAANELLEYRRLKSGTKAEDRRNIILNSFGML